MELRQLTQETLRGTGSLASFLVSRLSGGAWGELGNRYGEALGAHEPHQRSLLATTVQLEAI